MCGLAGVVASTWDARLPAALDAILDRLAHRGPDDHGWLSYSRSLGTRFGQGKCPQQPAEVLLQHRRLSILDLSEAGRQPMSSPDGRYWIVFNGEIYNYLELRAELSALGYSFRTGTDTEVLLTAIIHWGTPVLRRLVGMFAFAVLDTVQRTLMLARDFFGIKPLYYARTPTLFGFASEIKALLELPGIARTVNPGPLLSYLEYGLTDHGAQTLLRDVEQLPPAHYLTLALDQPGEASLHCYWRLDLQRRAELPLPEAASRLRELFLDSVRLHLRSDVPVGTALSGGIDSSAIVMGVREVAGQQVDFHSFSFIAADPSVSEERWVDLVARAAATTVHKIRIEPEELVADLERLIATQDEPFGSTSVYAQQRIFRAAQEAGVKVLLDGQGADEMLAGYRSYFPARLLSLVRSGRLVKAVSFLGHANQLGVSPLHMMKVAMGHFLPTIRRSLGLWRRQGLRTSGGWASPWVNSSWFEKRGVPLVLPPDRRSFRSLRDQLLETLTRSSLPMLLRYEDRNSMAHSIESRVPFLTPQLVEFAFSLPEEYLLSPAGVSKHVFREALRGILPEPIRTRRDKIGFATPEKSWLKALGSWVPQVLSSEAAHSIPVFRHAVLNEDHGNVVAGKAPFDWRIWRWLNLIRWSELLGVKYE